MRRYIFLLGFVFSALCLCAENATNIRVRQEGTNIIVTYDLSKKSVVDLLMACGDSTEFIILKVVTGDVGKGVLAGTDRQIVWKPLEEKGDFIAQNVRFKVDAQSHYNRYAYNAKVKTLVMGQAAYAFSPQFSYGGMLGQMYKGVGWYISGRSNFHFTVDSGLSCGVGGVIDGDEIPFYNGKRQESHWMANAGVMVNCLEWFTRNKFNTCGIYVGGGYGKRELYWETTDNQWIKYDPTSYEGITADIGLFGSVYGVTLAAGVTSIAFKYMEITVSLGYVF